MARYAARWIYMALIDAVGRLMALGSDDSPGRWTDRHRIRRARQIQVRIWRGRRAASVAAAEWERRGIAIVARPRRLRLGVGKDGDACIGNVGGGRDASAASGAIGMGGGGCEDVVGGGWHERKEERWTSTAFQGGSDEVRVAMTAEGSDAVLRAKGP
uniref:DUF834 domain-containing protein n=1 Tax=Oryza meridionalis TaxID=40149 RepID=A0A0E0DY56_9ORYZ